MLSIARGNAHRGRQALDHAPALLFATACSATALLPTQDARAAAVTAASAVLIIGTAAPVRLADGPCDYPLIRLAVWTALFHTAASLSGFTPLGHVLLGVLAGALASTALTTMITQRLTLLATAQLAMAAAFVTLSRDLTLWAAASAAASTAIAQRHQNGATQTATALHTAAVTLCGLAAAVTFPAAAPYAVIAAVLTPLPRPQALHPTIRAAERSNLLLPAATLVLLLLSAVPIVH